MPAGEIKSPLPLTQAGVQQLLAKSCCCLFSQSWRAKPQQEMLQHSSGLSEGSPQLMGEDGHALQGAAGHRGGLAEDHSLPSRGWKCPQRELAVGDINSPVGFCVTVVNSFTAP